MGYVDDSSFNSCMVQLKFKVVIDSSSEEPGFNSCMVQLKFEQVEETKILEVLF